MNEYQLVEVNELNRLRLAALELSEVKTELSDLREDNETLRRMVDEDREGFLREGDDSEWDNAHPHNPHAGTFTRLNENFRKSACDPERDSYPGDCGHCDPDCPCEVERIQELERERDEWRAAALTYAEGAKVSRESFVPYPPQRPHESLVWAIFYATASGATEDPFGCADRDLETWRSRWPEDEAA